MTLDEAIEQFKYDAECNRADLDLSFAEDNDKVAEWLEDYKHIKRWKSNVMDGFCRYDASSFEELVANVRNKAIDDFANMLSSKIKYEIDDCADELCWIDEIAKQLKAGDSD